MAVAKRRAIDHFRHEDSAHRGAETLGHDLEQADPLDLADAVDHIEDDVLRLIFLTCHPALPAESRAALTLRRKAIRRSMRRSSVRAAPARRS